MRTEQYPSPDGYDVYEPDDRPPVHIQVEIDAESLTPNTTMENTKGIYNGICNRTACNNERAIFYNNSTMRYYCPKCARKINDYATGYEANHGHKLCVQIDAKDKGSLFVKA